MSDPASPNASGASKKRTWDACAGLHEAEAPLAHLDARIVFDDDYPEPIRYDPERKMLRYRGFMSHSSYVKLAALSDERAYQTALERVFVATSPTVVSPTWQAPWKGIAAAVTAVAVMLCGWYARDVRVRQQSIQPADEERVVTLKTENADEMAAHAPQATIVQPEGESRRPVER